MPFIGNKPSNNFVSLKRQDITGDGTASYTLDYKVASVNDILVYVNHVKQDPSSMTVSGTSLTMGGNVASTDDFYVIFLGQALQTVTPADNTITTAMVQDDAITDAKFSGTKGITSAQEFRLAADQTGANSAGTVLTNWEENDTDYQAIGSNWSQSSGIFSCSATGIYTVTWCLVTKGATAGDAYDPNIQISTDSGSTYTTRARCWEYINTGDYAACVGNTIIVDVADTSTFRLRFRESQENDIGNTSTIKGSSTESFTNIVFVRLGDT